MQLPRDLEAEKAILSISMSRPDYFVRVLEFVDVEHFHDANDRKLFAQMKEFHRQGKAFAAEDLYKKAGVLPSTVGELIGYTPTVDPTPYCQSVVDTWRRREAIKILEKAQSQLFVKKGAVDTIAGLQGDLIGLCKGTATRLVTLESCLKSAYETICDAFKSREFPGVPSHLNRLNEVIGGFRKGNLIVIGARPGVGKTAIAVNFTHHLIKRGSKILFISAEMTGEEIATRLISIESGVSADRLINKPNRLHDDDLKHVAAVISQLASTHCLVLDESNVRSDRLFLAAASAEQRMGGLDLVIVDYLQILEGKTRQHIHSKADYLGEVTKDLKSLAKKHEVPVVALAQLNRESENDELPSLRNFADTSQIEKESDVAMILWRKKQEQGSWEYQLRVVKNRNGQTGLIHLQFDEEHMYFSESDRSFHS